jgi:antirestriction protein ArdC
MAKQSRKKSSRKYDSLASQPAEPRLDVHDAITRKIVAAIEAGAGTFEMPWHRPGIDFSIPKNAFTGNEYRGTNILSLWLDADERKYQHQIFATFIQWKQLIETWQHDNPTADDSYHGVRKGEKGSLIVKYGDFVPKNERLEAEAKGEDFDEEAHKRLYAKAAWVFNIDQVDLPDGLRAQLLPTAVQRPDLTERLAHADFFFANTGVPVHEGGQRAFYRHPSADGSGDFIQMPPRHLFTGTKTSTPTEAYYGTLSHEGLHASGAKHRLDRAFGEKFGDKAYAFEELVAELGAAFLCAHLAIANTPRPDHAQYIAGWLEVLKGDNKAIFTAASLASKATEYLIGLQPKPAPTPGDGPQRPPPAEPHVTPGSPEFP